MLDLLGIGNAIVDTDVEVDDSFSWCTDLFHAVWSELYKMSFPKTLGQNLQPHLATPENASVQWISQWYGEHHIPARE